MSNKINVETYDKALTPTAYAVQHDTARVLQLVFPTQYLTESDSLSYVVKKPSGLSTYGPAEFVDQQTARIRFTSQDLGEEGLARGQLKITRAAGTISTFDFYIKVTADLLDAGTVESSNEFRMLDAYRQEFFVLKSEFDSAMSAVTSDTEVTDIRAKINGEVASTAGNAVREQVAALKAVIDIQKADGYLLDNLSEVTKNFESTLSGTTITSSNAGTVTINGTSTNTSTTWRTLGNDGYFHTSTRGKVIQLEPGKYKLWAKVIAGSMSGGASGDDVDILRVVVAGTSTRLAGYRPARGDAWAYFEVTEPTNINIVVTVIPDRVYDALVFIPFVCKDDGLRSNAVLGAELDALKPTVDAHVSPSMFTSGAVLGDSIAYGANSIYSHSDVAKKRCWLYNMARKNGWEDYSSCSRGGATTHSWLVHDADEPIDRTPYCIRFFEKDAPKQLYFVAFGNNDSNQNTSYETGTIVNVPVGTLADFDNLDWNPAVNNSFYGNLGYIVRLIRAKNPYAVICMVTPLRLTEKEEPYADAVVEIANHAGCLLIDNREIEMFKTSWWRNNIYDGHPTAPMYAAMADTYEEKLSEAIVKNVDLLKTFDGYVPPAE